MGCTPQFLPCEVFLVCVISCPTFAFFPLSLKSGEFEARCSWSSLGYSGMKSDIYSTVKAY